MRSFIVHRSTYLPCNLENSFSFPHLCKYVKCAVLFMKIVHSDIIRDYAELKYSNSSFVFSYHLYSNSTLRQFDHHGGQVP